MLEGRIEVGQVWEYQRKLVYVKIDVVDEFRDTGQNNLVEGKQVVASFAPSVFDFYASDSLQCSQLNKSNGSMDTSSDDLADIFECSTLIDEAPLDVLFFRFADDVD